MEATHLLRWNKRKADAIDHDEVDLILCKPAPLVAHDEKDDIDSEAHFSKDAHRLLHSRCKDRLVIGSNTFIVLAIFAWHVFAHRVIAYG